MLLRVLFNRFFQAVKFSSKSTRHSFISYIAPSQKGIIMKISVTLMFLAFIGVSLAVLDKECHSDDECGISECCMMTVGAPHEMPGICFNAHLKDAPCDPRQYETVMGKHLFDCPCAKNLKCDKNTDPEHLDSRPMICQPK
ncbi:uncharacterized protein LOC141910610 [Tubulanus polymorphus]|uniref:uncharacterized protein LOC141910610 n=1 Tax=Tubulanus polymorphus TaxID=672921 RepID=UPI003DA6B05F